MRFARFLPLFLILLYSAPCLAQTVDSTEDAFALAQAGAVPRYVVPVLRLVSKTHVEPTTGLVLSESGLVLVPAGFASAGDEIVVLDGGTDIVSNGRTARVERNFPMDGLQVLSVYGLRRPAAPFAAVALQDGDTVRLTAFPPAEQIAEGAQPLDIATTVTVLGENRAPAISGETPLPNVTGPLLDACGNVEAFSIAHDVQTMETTPGTRYQWREILLGIIERLGARPGPSACAAEAPAEETQPEPVQPQEEAAPEPEPAEPEPEPVEEEPGEETAPEDETVAPEEETPDILPPIELPVDPEVEVSEENIDTEPVEEKSGAWTWLLLAAVLIAAGFGLHFWRRRIGQATVTAAEEKPVPAALTEEGEPEYAAPAMDSTLALRGELRDGSAIDASCPVSSQAINVVIGRGQADLQIHSAAVSRQHAALNGTAGELTITDLGSNNGTTINGVPCLEGEIMFLEPGDTVTLGDARFTVDILPSGDGE